MEKDIVFMGCSSRDAINDEYKELTTNISNIFIDFDYSLATGGASSGMMGKSFLEFHKSKKDVFAYTVEKYEEDLENLPGSFKYIYDNTFDRTKSLYQKASMIIFLPGGTGTLAELFASIEENRTINNPKQIILYNYNGFFDKVLNLIYYCVTNKFNDESIYSFFTVISSEEELKQLLNINNKVKNKNAVRK
jgi:uncharacterized protein (TIGR00730 family)